MIIVVITSGILAALLALVCLRGVFHLIKAIQACDRPRVKALAWAELRLGLIMVGCGIISVTQGHGIRIAQVLLLISLATRLPANWRALRR